MAGIVTREPRELFGRPYSYHNSGAGAFGPRKPGVPHGGGCCLLWKDPLPWPKAHAVAGRSPSPVQLGVRAPLSALALPVRNRNRDPNRNRNRNRNPTQVQLGVLHYQLSRYQYVQQLYAFEASPPFALVALSDPFCWPDTTSILTNKTRLSRRGRAYPCAYIQMTMSVSAHLRDTRAAVVGIGMNDCSSRVALVPSIDELIKPGGLPDASLIASRMPPSSLPHHSLSPCADDSLTTPQVPSIDELVKHVTRPS